MRQNLLCVGVLLGLLTSSGCAVCHTIEHFYTAGHKGIPSEEVLSLANINEELVFISVFEGVHSGPGLFLFLLSPYISAETRNPFRLDFALVDPSPRTEKIRIESVEITFEDGSESIQLTPDALRGWVRSVEIAHPTRCFLFHITLRPSVTMKAENPGILEVKYTTVSDKGEKVRHVKKRISYKKRERTYLQFLTN